MHTHTHTHTHTHVRAHTHPVTQFKRIYLTSRVLLRNVSLAVWHWQSAAAMIMIRLVLSSQCTVYDLWHSPCEHKTAHQYPGMSNTCQHGQDRQYMVTFTIWTQHCLSVSWHGQYLLTRPVHGVWPVTFTMWTQHCTSVPWHEQYLSTWPRQPVHGDIHYVNTTLHISVMAWAIPVNTAKAGCMTCDIHHVNTTLHINVMAWAMPLNMAKAARKTPAILFSIYICAMFYIHGQKHTGTIRFLSSSAQLGNLACQTWRHSTELSQYQT